MSVPTRRLVDSAGADSMGLVTASPTANTLLARLKAIEVAATNVITTPLATEVSISTGNTSEAALAANANRVYALFVNNSDTKMYIRLGETSIDNEGIPLIANGGFYEITAVNLYRGLVNVICATSGKILLVTEGV